MSTSSFVRFAGCTFAVGTVGTSTTAAVVCRHAVSRYDDPAETVPRIAIRRVCFMGESILLIQESGSVVELCTPAEIVIFGSCGGDLSRGLAKLCLVELDDAA